MKKSNIKSLFGVLLLATLLSSCSITGRRYMSGYHVEWRSKKAAIHQNAVINKSVKKAYPLGVPVFASNDVQNPVSKSVVMLDDKSRVKQVNTLAKNNLINKFTKNNIKYLFTDIYKSYFIPSGGGGRHESSVNNGDADTKASLSLTCGIISFVLAILSFFGLIIGLASGSIVGGGGYTLAIISLLGFVAAFILGLVALIIGAVAKGEIGQDRDSMRKDWNMANAGTVLGGIVVVGLILLIGLLFLGL